MMIMKIIHGSNIDHTIDNIVVDITKVIVACLGDIALTASLNSSLSSMVYQIYIKLLIFGIGFFRKK